MTRRLFVTTALPYTNAPFHIGHKNEHIQADTWVRFQRMRGHEVHFVCADDARGAHIHHGHSTDPPGSHAPARSIHAKLSENQQRLSELLAAGVADLRDGLIVHTVTIAGHSWLGHPHAQDAALDVPIRCNDDFDRTAVVLGG